MSGGDHVLGHEPLFWRQVRDAVFRYADGQPRAPLRSLETHGPRGPPETHCRPVSAPVAGAVRGPSLSRLGWTKAVASSLVRVSIRRRPRDGGRAGTAQIGLPHRR